MIQKGVARDPLPLSPERTKAVLGFARALGLSADESSSMSESLLAALDEELARSTLSGSAPAPPRDAPVSDRFVVMAVLGRGAMGDVYRGFDRKLERFVALKVLRATDARARERLQKEARAQAQVEHPGVCRIFDVTDEPAPGLIAMELIDGETLDATAAALALDDKLALAVQIADAVAAAHARGVLHRDLKPQNILVTRSLPRRAVVTDFGLARGLDEQAVGGVAGTPGFMAPEQARGEAQLTPATDVFGLGATLYALFAGRAPFPGARAEALQAILRGPPPSLRGEVPRDLAAVIDRCLLSDPSRRYASAAELADELRRVRRRRHPCAAALARGARSPAAPPALATGAGGSRAGRHAALHRGPATAQRAALGRRRAAGGDRGGRRGPAARGDAAPAARHVPRARPDRRTAPAGRRDLAERSLDRGFARGRTGTNSRRRGRSGARSPGVGRGLLRRRSLGGADRRASAIDA